MDSAPAAEIVVAAIRWMHMRGRLSCGGYVVMPDHFHAIFELTEGYDLADIMQTLCGFTGHRIASELGVDPPIWQAGY